MSCIVAILLGIDFLGVQPGFFHKGNGEIPTIFGGIISLVIYALTLYFLYQFGLELIKKENPTVGQSTEIFNHPGKILYPDELFFMFAIEIDYKQTIDESLYYPQGMIHITKPDGTIKINVDMKRCSEVLDENFVHMHLLKEKYNLENYYCMAPTEEQKKEMFTNEFWGNPDFHMLQIKVYKCGVLNNPSGGCKTDTEIAKKLHMQQIGYIYTTNFIDTNNHKQPFTTGIQEKFYTVSPNFLITATHYNRIVEVVSDEGILFSSENSETSFRIDDLLDYADYTQESDVNGPKIKDKFFQMSIQTKNTKDTYTRSYSKIQDLFAEVDGMFAFICFVFALIMKFYADEYYFEALIDDFFDVNKDYHPRNKFIELNKSKFPELKEESSMSLKDNKPKQKKKQALLDLLIIGKKHKDDSIDEESSVNDNGAANKPQTLEPFDQIKKDMDKEFDIKHQVDFGFWDRLCGLKILECCDRKKLDPKYDLYYKGKDYITNLLEVSSFLKQFYYLRMYFNLILDEEQKKVFEYVMNPILGEKYLGPKYPPKYMPKTVKEFLLKKQDFEKEEEKVIKELIELEKQRKEKKKQKDEKEEDQKESTKSDDESEIKPIENISNYLYYDELAEEEMKAKEKENKRNIKSEAILSINSDRGEDNLMRSNSDLVGDRTKEQK